MRLIYEKDILTKILEALLQAEKECVEVKEVELTRKEYDSLLVRLKSYSILPGHKPSEMFGGAIALEEKEFALNIRIRGVLVTKGSV